jgi:hypothetical protein
VSAEAPRPDEPDDELEARLDSLVASYGSTFTREQLARMIREGKIR